VAGLKKNKNRCKWAESHELFIPYHDLEWGVPVHDDRILFEMINLEGAQAGLSWLTILKKRESYRQAFDHFDAQKIVKYRAAKKAELLKNEGIVRNRLKVDAVIENARAYLEVSREFGSFDRYLWQFVEGKPLPLPRTAAARRQAIAVSEAMSKALKKRGFKFVGATICYAFMQAVGMVNDHSPDCFRASQRFKSK
jgi:DNA-3-methyladenine glycosylase I